MSKLIALRSGFNDGWFDAWRSNFSSRLKQQALLFDQTGIYQLRQMHKIIGNFKPVFPSQSENNLASLNLELEWLEENGIVFELSLKGEITDQTTEILFGSISPKKEGEINSNQSKRNFHQSRIQELN
jgi:hypothetical protein